jgi:hypothetical protein
MQADIEDGAVECALFGLGERLFQVPAVPTISTPKPERASSITMLTSISSSTMSIRRGSFI